MNALRMLGVAALWCFAVPAAAGALCGAIGWAVLSKLDVFAEDFE